MKHFHDKNIENIKINRDLAITIGKFDGLHKGHMALIAKLKEVAAEQRLVSAVLSFTPHPAAVLRGKDIPLILSPQEKSYVLNQMDVDYYIEYPFTQQFAQVSSENFIKNILFQQFGSKALIVGENFRFGKNGLGDVALAERLGAEIGLHVHIMPLVADKTAQISSENIRRMVAAKDFHGVYQACGRNYFIMGDVVHGKKKGREMGFPTANIVPHKNKLLPPLGVYYTSTFVDNIGYPSITNVGADTTETHLLGYSGDLYGCTIRIDFLQWMRDMQSFASYDDLALQLTKDAVARKAFDTICSDI